MKQKLFIACLGLALSGVSDAAIVELIQNNHFGSGSLAPWVQTDPASPQEWGVTSGGSVGGQNIHAADYSPFATPWTNGPNPSTTTIAQTVDLSPYIGSINNDTLNLSADLIYSGDSISCTVRFYDNTGTTLWEQVLAEKRDWNSYAGNYALAEDLTVPQNAVSVEVLFEGKLYDGSYIDAGFDSVYLKADIVPEPSISMIGLSFLLLPALTRRRK